MDPFSQSMSVNIALFFGPQSSTRFHETGYKGPCRRVERPCRDEVVAFEERKEEQEGPRTVILPRPGA